MKTLICPEDFWNIDDKYLEDYRDAVAEGMNTALCSSIVIVSIARNAARMLPNTLALVEQFRSQACLGPAKPHWYVFENDSDDGTAEMLDAHAAANGYMTVEHATLNRPHLPGELAGPRTEALAEYRQRCMEWVRVNAPYADYVIVLDIDPEGGFSVDGIFNSIAQLDRTADAYGMGSYSLYLTQESGKPAQIAHYDSWAARPVCWWEDRREEIGLGWFSMFLPPVAAPIQPMNSCFGGLAVYKTEYWLMGRYSGEDCEHVCLHKSIADKTGKRYPWPRMYLNPGSRYAALIREG
jgi:hypothetical protein